MDRGMHPESVCESADAPEAATIITVIYVLKHLILTGLDQLCPGGGAPSSTRTTDPLMSTPSRDLRALSASLKERYSMILWEWHEGRRCRRHGWQGSRSAQP